MISSTDSENKSVHLKRRCFAIKFIIKSSLIVIFAVVLFNCPRLRIFLLRLPSYLRLLPRDIMFYFKHKKYNNAPIGTITAYVADSGTPFGSGKTLSSVKKLVEIYGKYNGLTVYHNGKFVKQYIRIFSNIDIKCAGAIRINCLQEYSDYIESHHDCEDRYVCYLHVDEAGSEFNSRAFAGNFSPDFISDIVTCRHNWSSFLYTAQSFGMVDKLLRSVTTNLYACSHTGRVFFNQAYLPKQVENVDDISMLKPFSTSGYLATDKLYSTYDTHARFERLSKEVEQGQTLSVDEIIARKEVDSAYNYVTLSHKGKRFFKRKNKQ